MTNLSFIAVHDDGRFEVDSGFVIPGQPLHRCYTPDQARSIAEAAGYAPCEEWDDGFIGIFNLVELSQRLNDHPFATNAVLVGIFGAHWGYFGHARDAKRAMEAIRLEQQRRTFR